MKHHKILTAVCLYLCAPALSSEQDGWPKISQHPWKSPQTLGNLPLIIPSPSPFRIVLASPTKSQRVGVAFPVR